MNDSDFTPGQRRTVILMVIAVIGVFALLAGIVVTSFQSWESPLPAATLPFVSWLPTPLPTPSPIPSPTLEEGLWPQVQAARLFDQIAHQVEILRGLYPRAEVPLSFLDEREMTMLLRQLYAKRDPEAELFPHIALGLLPDVPISICAHQVAGVYVPEQEQLYVATGQQESSVDDQALLAHAYTHVLQDQHFDLGAMDARAMTTDATLAVRALVEGDATLLTALYRYENLAAADWERLAELILQAEQPGYGEELDRVEAWARLQRFPYREGRQFTTALFQADGWEAINHAYTDPPRSTEQVLHLERYLEERDAPASVVVPDLSVVLGEGWTMLLRDTLGEFVTGLYLDETLPGETAWQAADGWDGDNFVVWEHEDGRRVLVWRTVWDSTAEAAEFEYALVALIPQRYLPARPADPPAGLAGRWWETDAGAVYVCRVARYVIFVQAPDVNALANVVEVLP
ncbi:MAG: hypothetical protein KAW49_16655 [Anaerolineae bacterium]|nr:hypothetical protein [Anaerolineae bacterium]